MGTEGLGINFVEGPEPGFCEAPWRGNPLGNKNRTSWFYQQIAESLSLVAQVQRERIEGQ